MSDMKFAIEIGAKDKTQGGLQSALRSVTGFARGAMGALRDYNMGLRPLIGSFDRMISQGGELEVITKAFRSMTRVVGGDAGSLAKNLVAASSGTLKLAEAIAIANRALGSGMKFNDVATAIEFIGKKSISSGKDAKNALDTVITGLSRGSTLFLDDFGILVDGLDGVKRTFDSMKGRGAFDALGPAAQKTETVRQAIAEMSTQMTRLGVTGRETVFVYAGLKNQIGDAVDKLNLAVIKSKSLHGFLTQTRDLVRGLGNHFDKGGSLTDVLFGKPGGKSGGLAGVAGAALGDIGKNIGHGIAGSLFQALGAGAGALSTVFTEAETQGIRVISVWENEGKAAFTRLGGAAVAELTKAATTFMGLLPSWARGGIGGGAASRPAATTQPAGASVIGLLGSGLGAIPGAAPRVLAQDAAATAGIRGVPWLANKMHGVIGKELAKELIEQQNLRRVSSMTADSFGTPTIAKLPGQAMTSKVGMFGLKAIAKVAGPLLAVADFGFTLRKFVDEALGLQKDVAGLRDAEARLEQARIRLGNMKRKPQARGRGFSLNPILAAGQAGALAAFGMGDAGGLGGTFKRLADEQFAQVGFSGLRKQVGGFMDDFGLTDAQQDAAAKQVGDLASRLPMSKAKMAELEREQRFLRRKSGIISRGGFGINQAARREAMWGLKSLREAGRDLSDPATRNRVFRELEDGARRRMIREAKEGTEDRPGVDARLRGVNQAMRNDNAQRWANRQAAANELKGRQWDGIIAALQAQVDGAMTLVGKIDSLLTTLTGVNGRAAAAK